MDVGRGKEKDNPFLGAVLTLGQKESGKKQLPIIGSQRWIDVDRAFGGGPQQPEVILWSACLHILIDSLMTLLFSLPLIECKIGVERLMLMWITSISLQLITFVLFLKAKNRFLILQVIWLWN